MMFSERTSAWASLVPVLVLSAAIAPKDAWFLPNFTFYMASQLAVLGVIAAFRPRPAVAAGSALALAAYLAGYACWVFTRTPAESMAWLGYLFVLPGALLPIAGAVAWLRGRGACRRRCAGRPGRGASARLQHRHVLRRIIDRVPAPAAPQAQSEQTCHRAP